MRRVSEELTRSELESMERDDEFASFCPDQQFRIAVHEHQRQAREAVNQAVRESKIFRIEMTDGWKKMKEGWHNSLDPKLEMLYVVKEAICCMNIKFFFKQEKKKRSQ